VISFATIDLHLQQNNVSYIRYADVWKICVFQRRTPSCHHQPKIQRQQQ